MTRNQEESKVLKDAYLVGVRGNRVVIEGTNRDTEKREVVTVPKPDTVLLRRLGVEKQEKRPLERVVLEGEQIVEVRV